MFAGPLREAPRGASAGCSQDHERGSPRSLRGCSQDPKEAPRGASAGVIRPVKEAPRGASAGLFLSRFTVGQVSVLPKNERKGRYTRVVCTSLLPSFG